MARRSPRVVWLPPTTQNAVGQQPAGEESAWKRFIIEIGPGAVVGSTVVGEVPIVIDGTDDPTNAFASISDLYNSSYRLRRIVGKIFFSARDQSNEPGQDNGPRVLGITAGFIVRRSDPNGQSFAGLTGLGREFNPSLIANSNDPWIWRRSWIIGRISPAVTPDDAFPVLPNTNFGTAGASALDSGHIDQKTARIVGPEERLFLDVSVTMLANDGAPLNDGITFVDVVTELRVLASIKSGSGNRRNASR